MDWVESIRHTSFSSSGLAEAPAKPDKHLSAPPAIPRSASHEVDEHSAGTLCTGGPRSSLRPAAPDGRLTGSAEALRPAAALPAAPVGRAPHGYDGRSAPGPALAISPPTLAGVGDRFRRFPYRTCCVAVGAVWPPEPGVPGLERATWDGRPLRLPRSRTVRDGSVAGAEQFLGPCVVPLPLRHLLREVCGSRGSQVRQCRFPIATSVTFASWPSGSASRLARVPPERGLMPAMQGHPHGGGGAGQSGLTSSATRRVHCDTA
jgi:hypothetical protein